MTREDILKAFQQLRNDIDSDNWLFVGTINPQMVDMAIDALAQPERKKGKWIENDNGTWSCDQCHSWIPDEQHYYANWCLYCGADMRKGCGE